jgi:hypothetical protein
VPVWQTSFELHQPQVPIAVQAPHDVEVLHGSQSL